MQSTEVRIRPWLEQGFAIFKENPGILILAGLIAVVLSVASIGILGGPMGAGMALIALALYDRRSPKPGAGDVFKGFSFFANSFLFVVLWILTNILGSLILGIIPVLGGILSFVFSWVLHAFLMFGFFLIADKSMNFWEASLKSIQVVLSNPGPFLGFGVLAAIIGSLGILGLGIGVVVTYPLQVCILAAAFRDVFGPAGAEQPQSASAPPPPPPPPPPSPSGE